MTTTISSHRYSLLLDRCRALAARFSRPIDEIDAWEKRLITVIHGLIDGRLGLGSDTDEGRFVTLPDLERPEDLGAPTLVALTITANSPEIWRAGPTWRSVEVIAKTMAVELDEQLTAKERAALDEAMSARLTRYLTAIRGRSIPRTEEVQLDV